MATQAQYAEQQRQADELARRVQTLRAQADELAARLAPRGFYDRATWEAEARADQASHELAKARRDREDADKRLSALREQLAALA